MAPRRRKNEFYVVYQGRVDKPTIYSSWAHVHPRVIQCDGADHEKFDSYEDALDSIKSRGFTEIEKNLKNPAEGNAISLPRGAYYAVAQGKSTGIFKDWHDAKGAVEGITSACHQRFDTEEEAKKFIEDWKDAYAEIWRRAIRQGLDDGWKPKDMDVDIGKFLTKMDDKVGNVETLDAGFEWLDTKKELQMRLGEAHDQFLSRSEC